MNYFANKEESMRLARLHTAEMSDTYADEIAKCVERSEIISAVNENSVVPIPTFPATYLDNIGVVYNTTTNAMAIEQMLFQDVSERTTTQKRTPVQKKFGTKIAVLNFASFKNPGGMFLNGSMAQEESLCHESYLYNVLSKFQEFYDMNKMMLNRSLYVNRGIYSPDVRFALGCINHSATKCPYTIFADVFTIPAPNAGAARRNGVSENEISETLRKRIHFVIQSMLERGPYRSVILGAFGCGVFKNSPDLVAKLFYRELDNPECREKFFRVIFAIVGDNIQSFQDILKERRDSFGV